MIRDLFDICQAEKAQLKEIIKEKQLALIVDELSNDGQYMYVLDVMAECLNLSQLQTQFFRMFTEHPFYNCNKQQNHVSAVLKTVHEHGTGHDDICVSIQTM